MAAGGQGCAGGASAGRGALQGPCAGTSREPVGAPPGPALAEAGLRAFAVFQAQDKLCWSHGAAGSSRPRFVFIPLTAPLPRVQMVLPRAN